MSIGNKIEVSKSTNSTNEKSKKEPGEIPTLFQLTNADGTPLTICMSDSESEEEIKVEKRVSKKVIKKEIKKEIKGEIKKEIRNEVKEEIRNEDVKNEVKEEIKKEIKNEVKEEIRKDEEIVVDNTENVIVVDDVSNIKDTPLVIENDVVNTEKVLDNDIMPNITAVPIIETTDKLHINSNIDLFTSCNLSDFDKFMKIEALIKEFPVADNVSVKARVEEMLAVRERNEVQLKLIMKKKSNAINDKIKALKEKKDTIIEKIRTDLNRVTSENESEVVKSLSNIKVEKVDDMKEIAAFMFEKAINESVYLKTYTSMIGKLKKSWKTTEELSMSDKTQTCFFGTILRYMVTKIKTPVNWGTQIDIDEAKEDLIDELKKKSKEIIAENKDNEEVMSLVNREISNTEINNNTKSTSHSTSQSTSQLLNNSVVTNDAGKITKLSPEYFRILLEQKIEDLESERLFKKKQSMGAVNLLNMLYYTNVCGPANLICVVTALMESPKIENVEMIATFVSAVGEKLVSNDKKDFVAQMINYLRKNNNKYGGRIDHIIESTIKESSKYFKPAVTNTSGNGNMFSNLIVEENEKESENDEYEIINNFIFDISKKLSKGTSDEIITETVENIKIFLNKVENISFFTAYFIELVSNHKVSDILLDIYLKYLNILNNNVSSCLEALREEIRMLAIDFPIAPVKYSELLCHLRGEKIIENDLFTKLKTNEFSKSAAGLINKWKEAGDSRYDMII